ncbi:unnamed protein product [Aphanomyces euteiches]
MYSIAIVCTFGLLTVCYNWYFPAILDDGTILKISKDNVTASRTPDSWKLQSVFISSICFGLWLTLSTIGLGIELNARDEYAAKYKHGFDDIFKNVQASHNNHLDYVYQYTVGKRLLVGSSGW